MVRSVAIVSFFFFNDTATTEIYTLSLHDALPIWKGPRNSVEMVSWDEANDFCRKATAELRQRKLLSADKVIRLRSEEHTSELQSQSNLVCRLLLVKDYDSGIIFV